ncbi:MAG: glycosyltransferase family 4 protein [Candidatus Diapherotrites archaeon]|uniref:Glycosyltransferase family 4 protein n=1 Tax=Candidatus Iainarchaeum sp. TaxID=3101447 RepID=A0A939C728_9ARCH|nr:glycosyltransferase family 4 protein [Candidatus Diapherotrites archaeon]
MKIVLLTSWPPRHCGIATYSNELARALKEQGHEVHIVTFSDGGRKSEENVHPVLKVNKGRKLVQPNWDEALYREIEKIGPDVVHVQHEYALYLYDDDFSSGLFRPFFRWKVDANFPVVATFHSVYTALDRVESYYMDIVLEIIDAGIVHEEYQKIYLPENIGRLPDNVYVIPHGAKDIKPDKSAKNDLGLKGKKVAGLIGWWEPNKGFERVVKIWPKIRKQVGKNAVLVVAGDARPGSKSGQIYKPKLIKAIERSSAKSSIKLIVGAFTPQEYDRILSSFDLMVLPYSRASQSGNLAHAFALGVPCIATAMEGLKAEIESSKGGITVPPGDDLELMHGIAHLMKHDELLKRYARNAAKHVTKQIKWSIVARKHVALYEKLIGDLREECRPKKKESPF